MQSSNERKAGTIGILLIGDEILSGSIQDLNSDYIIKSFSRIGYQVEEIRIIPDNRERIAEYFRELSPRFDYLISTGGVGPTHDDITLESAAEAFGVPLVLDRTLAEFLENHYGERMNDSLRRMAMIPQGAQIGLGPRDASWPLIWFGNTFILPGLPRALQDKIDRIVEYVPARGEFAYGEVFLTARESDYVDWLNHFEREHATVSVGSYPYWDQPDYNTRITVRGRDFHAVEAATEAVVAYAKDHGWLVDWTLNR